MSAAGTVTTRSTVAWLVYGSVGWASVGGSEMKMTDGLGEGVAVTPCARTPERPADPPKTPPIPRAPTYTIPRR